MGKTRQTDPQPLQLPPSEGPGAIRGKAGRDIQPDHVVSFLDDLEHGQLAASTINKYRTILCSTFNSAIRREKFDRNPVSVVPQRKEPPGYDHFLSSVDFRKLIDECRAEIELYAFVWLAAPAEGEILPRKWTEIEMEGSGRTYMYRGRRMGCQRDCRLRRM